MWDGLNAAMEQWQVLICAFIGIVGYFCFKFPEGRDIGQIGVLISEKHLCLRVYFPAHAQSFWSPVTCTGIGKLLGQGSAMYLDRVRKKYATTTCKMLVCWGSCEGPDPCCGGSALAPSPLSAKASWYGALRTQCSCFQPPCRLL